MREPLAQISVQLRAFPWDPEDDLVVLRPEHVVGLLERFLGGELQSRDVHDWADLVECREDIGLDPRHADALSDVIFQLANPDLQGQLDRDGAARLIARLR
jgi:hypothetical protein